MAQLRREIRDLKETNQALSLASPQLQRDYEKVKEEQEKSCLLQEMISLNEQARKDAKGLEEIVATKLNQLTKVNIF